MFVFPQAKKCLGCSASRGLYLLIRRRPEYHFTENHRSYTSQIQFKLEEQIISFDCLPSSKSNKAENFIFSIFFFQHIPHELLHFFAPNNIFQEVLGF